MTTVAAIDCGTNSIRLLIAKPLPGGGLEDLDRRTEIVRLGQGVDATGEFHPDAAPDLRGRRAVREVDQRSGRAARPRALRRHLGIPGRQEPRRILRRRATRLGVQPDVISGDKEAQLSFLGALSRVRPTGEPVLVMDIGGGSTELITGSARASCNRPSHSTSGRYD